MNIRREFIFLFLVCANLACFAVDFFEIAALREAADSLHSVGRTDTAAIVGERAIKLADASGDATQIVGTRAAQGVFLRSLGRIEEALTRYDEALEIVTSGRFRENPDQEAIEEIASLYINLATLDLDMQHKDEAARNALLAGDWIARSNDADLKSIIYGVAGSVLTGCGQLDDAMNFQGLAYSNAIEAGNAESAFRSAAYTMLIADRSGKKAEAREWRKKCEELMPEIQSTMALLLYYQAECSICLKNGDQRGAIDWFNKILSTDGIDNLPFVKFDCYNNLHLAQADLGDYREAYSTLLQSNELRDSLWQKEKAESLRELTVKYETKETELALAQSEARRSAVLMWLFAALGLLLLAIGVFVVYAGRQRRRRLQSEIEFAALRDDIGRKLTQQYVEGLENERRRMARELHDGVCNDLLAIQMNMSKGQPSETTAQLIDNCRESVRRISHELMPPEFAYASLDEVLRYFVMKQAEVCEGRISLTYMSEAPGTDWSEVPDSVALEIYRIVQEAVGNAVKHSGASKIAVYVQLSNNSLQAEISDNGTYCATGRRGIGMDSMRRRAASINGDISFETAESNGTTIHLEVNL